MERHVLYIQQRNNSDGIPLFFKKCVANAGIVLMNSLTTEVVAHLHIALALVFVKGLFFHTANTFQKVALLRSVRCGLTLCLLWKSRPFQGGVHKKFIYP